MTGSSLSSPRRTRRTRVLHVVQNLNFGGMERLIADIVRGVDSTRIESHILVLQYLGRFAADLDEVATLHAPPRQSRLSLLWPRALSRAIQDIRPDVVHTHSGVWYKVSLAARMARVPRIIHTEHGRPSPDPAVGRFLDRLGSRRTDVVVAVSESAATLLRKEIATTNCDVRVILNGIDTSRFQPRPDTGRLRGELGLPPATRIIGSVGRLEPLKGYDIMVRAFAHLLASGATADVRLVIAGDGSERKNLQLLSERLGVAGRVHLLGWRNDLDDLLSAFSIFTMSSRSEGTSVSLLEAMSSGVCPVVTDVGGNRAVLGPELAHRLVRSEDATALASDWESALMNEVCRRKDAARARQRVMTNHTARSMIDAYQALYLSHPIPRTVDEPAEAAASAPGESSFRESQPVLPVSRRLSRVLHSCHSASLAEIKAAMLSSRKSLLDSGLSSMITNLLVGPQSCFLHRRRRLDLSRLC